MATAKLPGIPQDVEPGKVHMRLTSTRENPLLGRKELLVEVWHMGLSTPNRAEVRKALSSMLGVDEELVVIRRIITDYGLGRSEVEVHVYNDKDSANAVEPLYIKLRNMPKEEARKIREEMRKSRKTTKK